MKINLKNDAKVEEQLKKVNGRAKQYTITTAEQVREIVKLADEKLAGVLPKSAWQGAEATCSASGPSNSYKYSAKSTRVVLQRGSSAWFVVKVEERMINPGSRRSCHVQLTAEQTVAASIYAEKKLNMNFSTRKVSEDASQSEKDEVIASARKMLGL
ncbi:MAG: hypothetical protein ACX93U_24100 [Salipiger thiooxidans]